MVAKNETATSSPVVTLTEAEIAKSAAKFAGAWDKTPARVLTAAREAVRLKESGMTGDDIVDALKSAIALEHASSLNRASDAALVADMAAGIKLSRPAISQLQTALARATHSKCGDANTVAAFYYAALNYVPSKVLKQIADDASELETGNADFVADNIVVARADAGAARRAKLAEKNNPSPNGADGADSADSVESSVSVTKNGAAAFTLAEILKAGEALAAKHPDNRDAIRLVTQSLVEELAN